MAKSANHPVGLETLLNSLLTVVAPDAKLTAEQRVAACRKLSNALENEFAAGRKAEKKDAEEREIAAQEYRAEQASALYPYDERYTDEYIGPYYY